ncbi:bifunctional DNA-formamidopyrimidine glycosylase/DNA-(apurinic or apyrimidinic site) lyase [Halobacillus naozhouensis]|uniref:Formamidopyrimidine-DNA glycosylase n=1 Tax=Halobacillus naozhouensis TaxID=554880 RepID=A0ABY8J242_9BACI|nr:bifunctional DNA-formamidopyrimidine glycosylase/DNA-(apurinic or apyrimidinic site) lyase [Halobacillus naozhouensis]WFT75458.1 bifunctional DNA-formamidopyrimidine glycosylase/DNA-(apurinic or apyrimidinic site) lyase [Halobacillus naozhouensis]
MPELPEMENYKILLQQKIKGRTIIDVDINRDKSINVDPENFMNQVQTQKVAEIERKAKHLLFHLENGYILVLHLMLGGILFYGTEQEKPERTIQIRLSFGKESLYFIGLRLGYLHLFTQEEAKEELADLGPEPLNVNFSLDHFLDLVKERRGMIKTTLVNQEFLSGVGNCYSDEIAWHAQLLPERNMDELNKAEKVQLYQSIRFILPRATQLGGYMDQPLFKGDNKTGSYHSQTYVYDREGKPCKRCGEKIVQIEISSRKTFHCPQCQS